MKEYNKRDYRMKINCNKIYRKCNDNHTSRAVDC